MPSPEVLDRFIATIEANEHVEAIQAFYAADTSMQENQLPPRTSKDVLVAHESNFLSRLRALTSKCVRSVFVNGELVVIRWIFEFEALDGTTSRLEELAYHRWEDNSIVEEKFFYDPRQLRPRA